MFTSNVAPHYRALMILLVLFGISGCASYHSHYSTFSAPNSAGEERQVQVTWQTASYPSWTFRSDRATPVRMETQCSRRVWRLRDASMEDYCGGPEDGIVACGNPALDQTRQGESVTDDDQICLELTDTAGADRIAALGRDLEIRVHCLPRFTDIDMGEETANADYLRASVAPYTFRVRQTRRGSLTERPSELDDSVCEVDD